MTSENPQPNLIWVAARNHHALMPLVDALAGPSSPSSLKPAGGGWWLLQGVGDAIGLREQLAANPALVATGQHGGGGHLELRLEGSTRGFVVPLAESDVDTVARDLPLAAWAETAMSRRITPRLERRFWDSCRDLRSVREVASDLVRLLGLTDLEEEPWRALGEAVGGLYLPDESSWVGTRQLGRYGVPYIVARGQDFWGVWDWATPEAARWRFPKTPEGIDGARAVWREGFLSVLASTPVVGDVRWAPLSGSGINVIMLLTPERTLFVIACTEVPQTFLVRSPGLSISPPALEKASVSDAEAARLARSESLADGLRIAELELSQPSGMDWRDAPSRAMSDLRTLYDWVLAQ